MLDPKRSSRWCKPYSSTWRHSVSTAAINLPVRKLYNISVSHSRSESICFHGPQTENPHHPEYMPDCACRIHGGSLRWRAYMYVAILFPAALYLTSVSVKPSVPGAWEERLLRNDRYELRRGWMAYGGKPTSFVHWNY